MEKQTEPFMYNQPPWFEDDFSCLYYIEKAKLELTKTDTFSLEQKTAINFILETAEKDIKNNTVSLSQKERDGLFMTFSRYMHENRSSLGILSDIYLKVWNYYSEKI